MAVTYVLILGNKKTVHSLYEAKRCYNIITFKVLRCDKVLKVFNVLIMIKRYVYNYIY